MTTEPRISFITLLLMISFASVNAVLFTPALPNIAEYFSIPSDIAQLTITWFLIGYALGQLLYGPIANRFGRKPGLYVGIILQILSSLLCVFAGEIHSYFILIVGRFFLALGSGVGLKMAFTLVNESYKPEIASQKISYLMIAFAVTPGIAIAIGGILTQHYGWKSCFYAGAVYGLVLLFLASRLPETLKNVDYNSFKISHLLHSYGTQFRNSQLVTGGLLMGGVTSFVYIFAAVAPFIAINVFGMNSAEYGLANILPPIGLILGSLTSARLIKKFSFTAIIRLGILITAVGVILMFTAIIMKFTVMFTLFVPMIIIYYGISFIPASASTIAMSHVSDKSHGAAVMSFFNMGLATLVVLSLGFFPMHKFLMPIVYIILCVAMLALYQSCLPARRQ